MEDSYLNFFTTENNSFDLNQFLLNDNVTIDNGACIIITPNQILFTRNIPGKNGKPGSGNHDETYSILTSILYDLPITNNIYIFNDKKIEESFKKNKFIREEQNILVRMINEGKGIIHMKAIFIEIPKTITNSQLNFLKYLEEKYEYVLTSISKKMIQDGELPLIYFKTLDNRDLYCSSFEQIINYAKNNLVDNNKEIIKEKYIIGLTLEDIHNKSKSI